LADRVGTRPGAAGSGTVEGTGPAPDAARPATAPGWLADAALAAGVAAAQLLWLQLGPFPPVTWWDRAFVLAQAAPLAWRRRRPMDVLAVVVWASLLARGLGVYPWRVAGSVLPAGLMVGDAAIAVAAYGAARRCPRRALATAAVVAASALGAVAALLRRPLPEVLGLAALLAAGAAAGLGRRRLGEQPGVPVDQAPPDGGGPEARPAAGGRGLTLEGQLALWPPLITLLGVLVYTPTYAAYERFYAAFGVSPDEVGLTYATILSREITWFFSQLGLVVAMLVVLPVCLLVTFDPAAVAARLRRGPGRPPPAWLRRTAALTALTLVLVGAGHAYEQYSITTPELAVRQGATVRPAPGAFFQARVDAVAVSWVADRPAPGELPSHLLHLGRGEGTSVFWDPAGQRTIRLPSEAVALTALPEGQPAKVLGVDGGDRLTVVVDGSPRPVALLGVKVPPPPAGRHGCGEQPARGALTRLLPPGTRVRLIADGEQLDQEPSRMYVYRLPDHALVNERLLRLGLVAGDLRPPDLAPQRRLAAAPELAAAERAARNAGRGIWGACGATSPPPG
jgi:endonuclease YncB( thermonuclease family)